MSYTDHGSRLEETAGLLDKGAGWPAGKGSLREETAGLLDKGAGWPAGQGNRLENEIGREHTNVRQRACDCLRESAWEGKAYATTNGVLHRRKTFPSNGVD